MSVSKAAKILRISVNTVNSRINRGMSVVEALKAPVRSDNPWDRNRLVEQTLIESV